MSWNEYKSFQIEQDTKNMIVILFKKPFSFKDHIYNYAIWCEGPTYCKVMALGMPFSPFYKHHYQNVLVVKFPLVTFKQAQNEVSLYEVSLTQMLRCVDPFLDPSTLLFINSFCFNSCK
jgi:hypothetical protein